MTNHYDHHTPSQTITHHHKPSHTITNHHKPLRTITHHHRPSHTITNHYAPSHTITDHHTPSQTIAHHHTPSQTITPDSRSVGVSPEIAIWFTAHERYETSVHMTEVKYDFLSPISPTPCERDFKSNYCIRICLMFYLRTHSISWYYNWTFKPNLMSEQRHRSVSDSLHSLQLRYLNCWFSIRRLWQRESAAWLRVEFNFRVCAIIKTNVV